jgi:hypothetical protein
MKTNLVGKPGSRIELRMKDNLDLKAWWGLPRTRIEYSVEDTLDFRAFELTPNYMN